MLSAGMAQNHVIFSEGKLPFRDRTASGIPQTVQRFMNNSLPSHFPLGFHASSAGRKVNPQKDLPLALDHLKSVITAGALSENSMLPAFEIVKILEVGLES